MDWIFYFVRLFFVRIGDFLRHWYISSFYLLADWTVKFLEWLDRSLALKVTARHWLHPLYQERNVLGYLVGFVVRTIRIVFAVIVYSFVIVFAAVVYLAWAAVPLWLVYKTLEAYGIKTDIF